VKPFKSDGWHHTSFYGRIQLDKLFLRACQFHNKSKTGTFGWHHVELGREEYESQRDVSFSIQDMSISPYSIVSLFALRGVY
jgi:hypothetical protein